ncbi:C4-type zinc ribbon domain-containing protein [Ignavibacteriales bacterium]
MKNNLVLFYQVQMIDRSIDKLEEQRGDLPLTVEALEARLQNIKESIEEKIAQRADAVERREANNEKIKELLDNQKRAKSQLYKVRNNKEYDTITKSIDAADAECTRLEKESDFLVSTMEKIDEEVESLNPMVDELASDLEHKRTELAMIKENNANEEQRLLKQRETLVAQMKKSDYSLYTRVRSAKKGLAVAKIRRNACSGCQTIIPAQRQLEIRRNARMFTCEYCGRIIVSAEVANDAGEIDE